jgi:hypothetical protein
MRHADAELQLWNANDRIERSLREAELARLAATGQTGSSSIRQVAGEAVIRLGVRLAGQSRTMHARPF